MMRGRRLGLALLLALTWSEFAWAQTAPTIAKVSAVATGGFLDGVSFGALPTVGCLSGLALGVRNSNIADLAVSDNQGNSYTRVASGGDINLNATIWLAPVVTSSGTFTVDIDDTNEEVNGTGVVFEVCGQGSPFTDDDGGISNVNSANQSCDLANTTFSHDLVLGVVRLSNSASAVAITEAMGWTLAAEREATEELSFIYQSTTSTGNFDPAWTLGAAHEASGACFSVKGTGAAPAGAPTGSLSLLGAGR